LLPEKSETSPAAELADFPLSRTQYHILASYDAASHELSIEEQIEYLNTSPVALDSLVFILEPQRLSARFGLLELFWSSGEPVDPYALVDGVLQIPLPTEIQPGETAELVLAYVYDVPETPAQFGYGERQLNLADWYAFAPVYGQEGWMVRPPGQVGEHLVYDLADYRVELRVSNAPEKLVVAAPVAAEVEGQVRRYFLERARNFTLSISPVYVLLQDPTGGVQAYVFPEHSASGLAAIGCISEALALFSRLYGDPELRQMTVVEADFPDGMEYDGLFFLNWLYFEYPGNGVQGGLCTLSVHETAHQWWYRLVGSDVALEPWLDEALCTFSELIYYEQLHPDLVNWWWGYRVNDFNPKGWVNSSIYDHSNYRSYVNAVYLRGVRFLDALRRTAGNEAMLNFMAAYARTFRFSQADETGFFKVWDTSTGLDAQPILDQYFKPPS
jgi:hypothetical protein